MTDDNDNIETADQLETADDTEAVEDLEVPDGGADDVRGGGTIKFQPE